VKDELTNDMHVSTNNNNKKKSAEFIGSVFLYEEDMILRLQDPQTLNFCILPPASSMVFDTMH